MKATIENGDPKKDSSSLCSSIPAF